MVLTLSLQPIAGVGHENIALDTVLRFSKAKSKGLKDFSRGAKPLLSRSRTQ